MTEEHEERRRDLENEMNEEASTLPPDNVEGAADAAPTTRNRASNLTEADRRRGGQSSARQQVRDAHGQFAGRAAKGEEGKERRARRGKNRS